MPTPEELEEAKRKAEEEEARRRAAESEEESSDDDEEELTVDQLKAKVADQQKHIKTLNRESAERRKKLEELEKAETERKQAELTEVEKATQRATKAENERLALAKENRDLKLQRDLEGKVRDAKLQFKNTHAANDAFRALQEILDDDETEVTDDHIKQLVKEREYLFGTPDPSTINSDGSKKGKSNGAGLTKEAVAAKRKSL